MFGQIQLYDFQTKNTACTIVYFLKREYWNQGITTKCIKEEISHTMEQNVFVRMSAEGGGCTNYPYCEYTEQL